MGGHSVWRSLLLFSAALLAASICMPVQTVALRYWIGQKGADLTKQHYTYSPLASFGRVPMVNGEVFELVQITPFDACTTIDSRMRHVLRGKALLVQRGGCSFVRKACVAQAAGAAAVVVYNSFAPDVSSAGRPKQSDEDMQVSPINYPVHMFGISTSVNIPLVMVSSREGIILNQEIMHGNDAVRVNITTESPPAACGAWDRWPDDPVQCNSRASQDQTNRLDTQAWLISRKNALVDVTGDVEMARIVFTIACTFCVLTGAVSVFRKTRNDEYAVKLQSEQGRRLFSVAIAFCACLFAAVSYGIDQWGGECESDHVATVFLFQRLASSLCVVLYLLEVYFVIGAPSGHTNPYLNDHAQSLPNACGKAWLKMKIASILFVEAWIAGQYASKERSYAVFSVLSVVRILLHGTFVTIAHCGAARRAYQSVFVEKNKSFVPSHIDKHFRFLMLARLTVVSMILQAFFLSVAILQQAYFVVGAGSLDSPADFLDGYFTRVALMQIFQVWAVMGFGSGLYCLFTEVVLRAERPDSLAVGIVEAKQALLSLHSSDV